MGHYASEIDPTWGDPKPSEIKLREVVDDTVRNLARCMFKGFDSMHYLDWINAEHAINTATAIDELITRRIGEFLSDKGET